jgi:hypothetical protein
MGSTPGNEQNINPNFTKDVFVAESNPYYAAFVEDTFHVSKTLTLTGGVRWDIFAGRNERFNRLEYFNPNATSSLNGVSYTGAEVYVNGSNRSPFTTNMKDFGPRLGFAWQPLTHFVVRGGAGIYYGPTLHNVASAGNDTDGFSSSTQWSATCLQPITNAVTQSSGNTVFNTGNAPCAPGQADNFTAPTPYSLNNPFPNPPGTPGGINPVFTTAPPGLANNLGIALSTVLHSQRTVTTYNFNFGLEYELPHQVVVSVGYVGSRGLFLPLGSADLNQLDLGTIASYGSSLCVVPDPSCMVPNAGPVSLNANFSGAATVPQWAVLQKYPQFGNGSFGSGNGVVVNGYPGGDSEYSSLQTKVQKRLTGHFTTLAIFTWGKIMTDDGHPPLGFVGSHGGTAQDWRNLRLEHSISPQDVKYSFTGSASYDLPVGKGMAVNLHGVADVILGGWTTNFIIYLGTGVPIQSAAAGGNPYFSQRADVTCNPAMHTILPGGIPQWVNYGCFAKPGTEGGGNANLFIPGNAPAYLDHVRTQGARNLDVSIYKTLKLTETKALRFDVSSYNLTNKPQFGYPSAPSVNEGSTTAGQITNTLNTPRQFQFGARFTF